LYDDQGKVGLGIHVARHLLDLFDLALDSIIDALEKPVGRPPVNAPATTWSVFAPSHVVDSGARGSTYSSNSGADLSAIQERVRAWRSRVSSGTLCEAGSTSRRMSSMSMAASPAFATTKKKKKQVGRSQQLVRLSATYP
jgi:hypothetical protein